MVGSAGGVPAGSPAGATGTAGGRVGGGRRVGSAGRRVGSTATPVRSRSGCRRWPRVRAPAAAPGPVRPTVAVAGPPQLGPGSAARPGGRPPGPSCGRVVRPAPAPSTCRGTPRPPGSATATRMARSTPRPPRVALSLLPQHVPRGPGIGGSADLVDRIRPGLRRRITNHDLLGAVELRAGGGSRRPAAVRDVSGHVRRVGLTAAVGG